MKHRIFESVVVGLCLGAVLLFGLGAATPTSYPPSPFTQRTGTNVSSVAWRSALGAASGTDLLSVSNTVNGHTVDIATRSNATAAVSNTVAVVSNSVTALTTALAGLSNSLPGGTNIVTLDGTQTISGPKAFTNAANTISGDGAGLTNLNLAVPAGGDSGWTNLRSFYRSAQIQTRTLLFTNLNSGNVVFFNAATNANPTNLVVAGGYSASTPVAQFTLPPLLGSNSSVTVQVMYFKTNATISSFGLLGWVGNGTNYAFGNTNGSLSAGATLQRFAVFNATGAATLRNANSYTSQSFNSFAANGNDMNQDSPSSALVDTSVPWQMYLGASSTAGATNVGLVWVSVTEAVFNP